MNDRFEDNSSTSWKPSPPRRSLSWGWILLGSLLLLGGAFLTTSRGQRTLKVALGQRDSASAANPKVVEKIVEKVKIVEKPAEPVTPATPPPPLPEKNTYAKSSQVAQLFNGAKVKTNLQAEAGERAALERKKEQGYELALSLSVKIPAPAQTLAELQTLNAALPQALPSLAEMMPTAKVSGFFYELYQLKQKELQKNLLRLDRLLTRHNFFDCETALELTHPTTQQRVLLIQGEMDVVADGSDGDRMPSFDDYIAKSDHFQPMTTYGWPKQTEQPNPLLSRYEKKITEAQEKLATASEKARSELQSDINDNERIVADLKKRSYLIAQEDPFIVIPLSMRGYDGQKAFAPGIGDYAVVMHGQRLFPAIVGDYGPSYKTGEASLRMAKEINAKASPYIRPESDLVVTYLIFPGSADKPFSAPDYQRWRERCLEHVNRLGGLGAGFTLHEWEDRLKKPPATAPTTPATPTPSVPQ
jgi:hypothetical protein